jgi:hypothetical protein
MQTITTVGLDIAKSVFQVHGVDPDGQALLCEADINGYFPRQSVIRQAGAAVCR